MKNNISMTMTDIKAWYAVDMVSLYEFLGKAAGRELGREVYRAAMEQNVPVADHKVSNSTYTGRIMKYPRRFLIEYFNANNQ